METRPPHVDRFASASAAAVPDLLAEITAGLASGNDLHELLTRFLAPLVALAGAQAGAVRVFDDAGGRIQLVASVGLPPAVLAVERSVEGGCGACGAALHGSAPTWAHDLSGCARRSDGAWFGSDCRRMLALPLSHHGRTLGIYNLFFDGCAETSREALGLLESAGALLGLALDNARLERAHLRAALASERQAIAAEVHDSIGQSLAFVKMRLPLLQDAIRDGDRARAESYFDDVRDGVRQAHANLRAVLTHMRTPMDPLGLAHALEAGADAFRARGGARLEVVNELPALQLAPAQEEQVFRIVQEALANVARHAAARQAWLHLTQERDAVCVLIEDDGSGLPAEADEAGSHYGLPIMRERAQRLGGTLELGPRPGGGTRVRLRFPLPAGPAVAAPVPVVEEGLR